MSADAALPVTYRRVAAALGFDVAAVATFFYHDAELARGVLLPFPAAAP
ncbi:hypothetical protein [Nocardia flavorosea]|uniref:Uncharacterized protein n=1 Tax=Nocardia flavorosea TaxID=53429 RepID=A0A846YCR2_9NOCA|nr:hypothetical protein [Nocardia flavorosea]NKY54968.1 hypothetical protein [Nocardia flavorosea]